MNKLIITVLLMVGLVGMIGTAAGTTATSPSDIVINIATDAEKTGNFYFDQIYSDGSFLIADNFTFAVTGVDGSSPNEIEVCWADSNNNWGQTGKVIPKPMGKGFEFDFKVRDNPALIDDATQLGNKYTIHLYAWNGTVLVGEDIVGSTTTKVFTEVPEFPTVALPIAAVLGLMFIISSRKKKE